MKCNIAQSWNHLKAMREVRQEQKTSPLLFNIYGEYIMQRALKDQSRGVSVEDRRISNLRYTDAATLVIADEELLVEIINWVKAVNEELRLCISALKTKVIAFDPAGYLPQSDVLKAYKKVDTFVYLGSTVQANGGSLAEMQCRIVLGKSVITYENVICNRKISEETRKRQIRTLVSCLFECGGNMDIEGRWQKKNRSIDAFEMWVRRIMLKILWTVIKTNKSIVEELEQPVSWAFYERSASSDILDSLPKETRRN